MAQRAEAGAQRKLEIKDEKHARQGMGERGEESREPGAKQSVESK